jgi:hypothetical protein
VFVLFTGMDFHLSRAGEYFTKGITVENRYKVVYWVYGQKREQTFALAIEAKNWVDRMERDGRCSTESVTDTKHPDGPKVISTEPFLDKKWSGYLK